MKISNNNLGRLFLSIAFPIHFWTIILYFRDFEWIADRSSSWDAIGVGAYGVMVALIETSMIFLLLVLIGLLLPKSLDEVKRVLLLTLLFYCVSGWVMIRKMYAIMCENNQNVIVNLLLSSNHPYRYLLLGITLVITFVFISVIGTTFLTIRNDRFAKFTQMIIDRVIILSMAYIFIDVVGIIIVIIRNT